MESSVPEPLAPDHPNLQLARTRLRRMLRFWALLFGAMGIVVWITLRQTHPLAAGQWLFASVLFALGSQPAYLVLASTLWGLSISNLIPGAATLLGPDPFVLLLDTGAFETMVLVFVRLVFVVMSMSQFLFYRILYGTERMTGLDESLPDIPEVVPNNSNQLARAAQYLALVAALGVAAAWFITAADAVRLILHLSAVLGSYAVGLGLGAAFSPTDNRGQALFGVFIGAVGFLGALMSAARI